MVSPFMYDRYEVTKGFALFSLMPCYITFLQAFSLLASHV
jgi:hypothetical protein